MSPLGHERLKVYGASLQFVLLGKELLSRVLREVAACGHFVRAAESIPLNIAGASSSWSPGDRITYLGHANGSALECAACLDVLVVKRLLDGSEALAGKRQLREIVSMLITMKNVATDRIRESEAPQYIFSDEYLFSHEKLDVYQTSLHFAGWVESLAEAQPLHSDLLIKLDKTSTSIVLNIAEGNGRFSDTDHIRFLGIAYRATLQSAALLDLLTMDNQTPIAEGRNMLNRLVSMLKGLSESLN